MDLRTNGHYFILGLADLIFVQISGSYILFGLADPI